MFGRIANILGWAGVALVLAGVATWLFRDDLVTLRQGFALAGLACILLYAASQWREMAATFARRPARYGTLAVVSVVVVLGLLIGLNYLAEKYNKRWDLTASRDFTLSDQTRRVVASLKEPLHLLVFGLAEDMQPFRDRLAEYGQLSDKVKVEYIDLNKDPALARQYQIQTRGTIVVEYQKRIERVTSTTNEQEITNAIIKAVQGLQRKLYFVTGHGEKDPGSSDERAGYNSANAALQRDNYSVETLALAQQPEVPADAAALVIAGPTRDYLAPELESLRHYLNKGGKALIMLDPPDTADAPPLTGLVALAAEWGIDVGNNVVVDQSSIGQAVGRGPGAPVVVTYPGHPITDRFRYMTLFPLARSVTPATSGPRNAQPLPMTPPKPGQSPADEPKRPETRIVVLGDSDFAANEAIAFEGNSNLFVNILNWISEQENLIAIRPKAPDDRRVTMTEDQMRLVAWLSLIFVPGAVFAIGVYTWWRRRG